jgi:hypothetical protein
MWSWPVVGGVVLFIWGGGLTFMTSSHPILADVCFVLGAILFAIKFLTWEGSRGARWVKPTIMVVLVILTCLGIWGNHGLNAQTAQNPPPPQPKPQVNQDTKGDNSPAVNTSGNNSPVVIGNNNVVMNSINSTDPKIAAKIDDLKKLILKQQGEQGDAENLAHKYPLGYVVFDINEQRSVFPYATKQIMEHWNFDWSKVELSEDKARNYISVILPTISVGNHAFFQGNAVGGPKRLGRFGTSFGTQDFVMRTEVLAIKPDGIVFLIGFDPPPRT